MSYRLKHIVVVEASILMNVANDSAEFNIPLYCISVVVINCTVIVTLNFLQT